MIKLVATDIDGTILAPEGEFTQSVKDCIKRLCDDGIRVVLVTGRMHSATVQVAEELNLSLPLVSYQGGLVVENGKVLYERYLTEELANSVIDWAKKENIHLNLYSNDCLYSESDCYEVQRYSKVQRVQYVVKSFDEINKDKINKLLAIDYENPDRIARFEKELQEHFKDVYIVKSTPYFLEFSNPEASKRAAVEFLQNYWGLKKEEILTIGDQNNDIALLRAGGVKVAMGNATEELKAEADYITASVFDDGFVRAMEKFCFIKCSQ